MSTTTPLNPSTFTTLPDLTTLLLRFNPQPPPTPSPHPTQVPGTTPLPTTTTAPSSGSLSLKEVPAATDALKHKLQRARAQVRELPDMSRGVAEQEREMAELEGRIRRQREVLGLLREIGGRFARGEEAAKEAPGGEREGGGGGGGGDEMVMR